MPRLPKLRGHGLHPAQCYSPAEIETHTGISETTVRAWIREGKLPALTTGNPHLVLGSDAIAFFKSLRGAPDHLQQGEFRCLHCKRGRKPLGGMVDVFLAAGAKMGHLKAICETCEMTMVRGMSHLDVPRLTEVFAVQFHGAKEN